jgi:hypothetical protein
MLTNTNIDLEEVRKRATEIRGNWSTTERRRRKGLPPDIPAKLRDIILAPRLITWATNSRG